MSNPVPKSSFVWSLTKRKVASLILIIGLICSVCVITGYTYATSIGAQNYPTSYMEGGPSGIYDYMIYTFENDTGTFYAVKNIFGDNIDSWTSTDPTATINYALNDTALAKKHVVIFGCFAGVDKIFVHSNTTLEVFGCLTAKDNLDTGGFIENANPNDGDYGIEVRGGVIDSNTAGQSNNVSTIYFVNVDFPIIHDCEISGGKRTTASGVIGVRGEGIELYGCSNAKVYNNLVHDTDYDNIKLRGNCSFCEVYGNTLENSTKSSCLQIVDGFQNNIYGNTFNRPEAPQTLEIVVKLHNASYTYVHGNTLTGINGISLIDAAFSNTISDNVFIQTTHMNATNFINLSNPSCSISPYNNTIKDNYGYNIRKDFVQILNASDTKIIDNTAYADGSQRRSGVYIVAATNTDIFYNTFTDFLTYVTNGGTATNFCNRPINRIADVKPTASGWGTTPTNLEYTTDSSYDTCTGIGTKAVSGAESLGVLTWDLGANYSVYVTGRFGLYANVSQTINVFLQYSYDGVTYVTNTYAALATSNFATTENVRGAQTEWVYARYIRLSFNSGAAMLGSVKIYDVKVMDTGYNFVP